MKLNEWLNTWLNKYVKHTIKLKTYFTYQNIIRLHIEPILGNINLNEISHEVLQNFINYKVEHGNLVNGNPLSTNTILSIKSILKQSFDFALKLGIIENNYLTFISIPKRIEKDIDAFELVDQKTIEKYCFQSSKTNYFGIIMCLYTGIRIGELLALTWNDVDFERKLLFVRHTVTTIKENGVTKTILQEPKTRNSKRVIPLPYNILNYLKKIKKTSKSQFIITTRNTGIVSIRSYQRTFDRILKRCNIAHKNFHALRHTFATRAIESGMDIKTLSEILGHKNATITLNRYSHSMLNYKIISMNKLSKLLNQ